MLPLELWEHVIDIYLPVSEQVGKTEEGKRLSSPPLFNLLI